MELSPQLLNSQVIVQHVEVNPYHRYFTIFKDLFHPDHTTDEVFRDALLDITLHFLAEIDRMQGMNKKEYYIRFMLRDINKVQLIQEIFLPIGFHMEVYWQYHFGIIDVEETMKLDRIALY